MIPEVMTLPNLGYSVLMTGDPPAIVHPYPSFGGLMWPRVGEWESRLRSLISDGWAPRVILSPRRVETNSTVCGKALSNQPLCRSRTEWTRDCKIALYSSLAPSQAHTDALALRRTPTDRRCCWLTSSMMSNAGSSTDWHVVQGPETQCSGPTVRSRHKAPLLAPLQRQAVKPGTVCSETKRRTA